MNDLRELLDKNLMADVELATELKNEIIECRGRAQSVIHSAENQIKLAKKSLERAKRLAKLYELQATRYEAALKELNLPKTANYRRNSKSFRELVRMVQREQED